MKPVSILFLTVLMIACNNNNDAAYENNGVNDGNPAPPLINYAVVNSFPHDTASFTEGLFVHEGQLFESTGSPESPANNGSWFGAIDLKTGKAVKKVQLDPQYFGEGITLLNGRIYQLTWQNHKGFVYDAKTFKKLREFSYSGEGWALTTDSVNLIMSDGSSNLRYLEPDSLRVLKIVGVHDHNGPLGNLNEIEYINGFIYSNIYLTDYIVKIDPASGRVLGKLDFTSLVKEVKNKFPGAAELNGIAYDSDSNKIYITGKCWPNLYEVRF